MGCTSAVKLSPLATGVELPWCFTVWCAPRTVPAAQKVKAIGATVARQGPELHRTEVRTLLPKRVATGRGGHGGRRPVMAGKEEGYIISARLGVQQRFSTVFQPSHGFPQPLFGHPKRLKTKVQHTAHKTTIHSTTPQTQHRPYTNHVHNTRTSLWLCSNKPDKTAGVTMTLPRERDASSSNW